MDNFTRSRISTCLPALCLVALALVVVGGFGTGRAAPLAESASPAYSKLVRWQDAGHDWLVVGDGQSDQLSIYNAVDGSLVRRMAVRQGLNDRSALAQRDGRLFIVDNAGRLGELKLVQLAAANQR